MKSYIREGGGGGVGYQELSDLMYPGMQGIASMSVHYFYLSNLTTRKRNLKLLLIRLLCILAKKN